MSKGRRLDAQLTEILRGAGTALALKVLALGLAFGSSVMVTRLLGANGAGLFFLTVTLVTVAATIGRVGLDATLVRYVAAAAASKDWPSVAGARLRGLTVSLLAAGILSAVLAVAAPALAGGVFGKPELTVLLQYAALAVGPLALLTLQANALKGLKQVRDHVLILSACVPLVQLLLLPFVVPRWGVLGAVLSFVVATVLTLLIALWRWRRVTAPYRQERPSFDTGRLLRTSWPLLGVSVTQLVIAWSPMLILGRWAEAQEIGAFSVASRTAMLTSLVLTAVSSIAAPNFAAMHNKGDLPGLIRVARHSTRLMLLAATPVAAVFVFIPETIMGVFGKDFVSGATMLTIMTLGQFVSVASGSVSQLLSMTGHERLLRRAYIGAAVLGVVLSFVLIPSHGGLGAAVAAACSVAAVNVFASRYVHRVLGMAPLVLVFSRNADGESGNAAEATRGSESDPS